MKMRLIIVRFCVLVCITASVLSGGTIYIDNVRGDDENDGRSAEMPLRSFSNAMGRAVGGDTIRLNPSPLPYRDMFVINGRKCMKDAPLVIDGGGNWVIGSEEIPTNEWRQFEGDIYIAPGHFKRLPKENFFLVINGMMQRMGRARLYQTRPLPAVKNLKPDEWTIDGNDLYVCIHPGFALREYRIERAARDTAFAFTARPSENIIVSNVNIKFVYNDGINLHCNRTGVGPGEGTRDISFIDVRADWNFDEGISAHDRCEYFMSNAVMIGNNCGVVNIDWSASRHTGTLIADSYDVDIMCYGDGYDSFEDCYIHSTRAFKNLKWEGGTNGNLMFSNSVFYFDPVNTNAFSLWANRSSRISIAGATLIDGSRKPLSPAAVSASGTVSIIDSTFIPAKDASDDMKRGASLSPYMRDLVTRYFSGELTGKGFTCVAHDTKPGAVRLTFNYPVDALSLAGIRFFRDGAPFHHASLRLVNDGLSVIAENFAAGAYRIETTPMLLSVRGTNGCTPRTIHVTMSGDGFVPKEMPPARYIRSDHPELTSAQTMKSGIFIEAEAGELSAPMMVRTDVSARGGKCIVVPQGTGLEKGSAQYRFEVTDPGDYHVWLRTIAATSDDDSIFVSMDGAPKKLSDIKASSSFAWDRVRDRIDGKVDIGSFVTFTLGKGTHTLSLMSREDGLLIDAIAIFSAATAFDSTKE
ncbi:MAG: hypothetical protein AABZ39_08940 [Spirochaetota bacterium]